MTRSQCCLCALLLTLLATLLLTLLATPAQAADRGGILPDFKKNRGEHTPNSYQRRQQVIASLPMQRLTRQAQDRILSIANSPTLYRRLPTQAINCDRDMFLFLTRNPEVLVGIWDLMGITKVNTNRTGPFQLEARDGSGTECHVDLVYGDPNLHIYVTDGSYDGKLVTKPILGRGVFVLRSSYSTSASGGTTVTGTIDCFVQIENLGADLVVRTLSGLIGRSADKNFVETARFMSQVSQASAMNPPAMIDVAQRMPQVGEPIKQRFVSVITAAAQRSIERTRNAQQPSANKAR
jgi:hypothetical protein